AQGIYESSRFTIPRLGVFHHFVATYKQVGANQVRIDMYIDAVLVKTKSVLGKLSRSVNNDIVTIGADSAAGGRLNGIIDEPAVFSRALTSVEVSDIYNAGSAGKGSSITNRPNAQVLINGVT